MGPPSLAVHGTALVIYMKVNYMKVIYMNILREHKGANETIEASASAQIGFFVYQIAQNST